MESSRNKLIQTLTLALTDRKGRVESSYFFHQLYVRLGIFEPINSIIQELVNEDYIIHDSYFDESSGLIKNIALTSHGRSYLENSLTEGIVSKMEEEFDNFEIIKKAITIGERVN